MSLIPLLLGRLSRSTMPVVAVGAAHYDPGSRHRPLAAAVALGLPAVLLVAVALSPFELPPLAPKAEPQHWKHIKLLPPPKPDPAAKPTAATRSTIAAPRPVVPPLAPPVVTPVEPVDPVAPTTPQIGTALSIRPPIVVASIPAPIFLAASLDSRFVSDFQPAYPTLELRNEIEGQARVSVLVGTDGRVKAVKDIGTTSPGFFRETERRALAKWRFKPASRGGIAEQSWFTITVHFKIND